MPHSPNTALTTLADRLIIRHLRVSVPNTKMRQNIQQGLTPEPLLQKRMRCVAVVGASASAPLMKRGDALATQLERRFNDQDAARRAELFRLQRVYKLDGDDFETRLAALSRTPEVTQEVKATIAEWYAYRHPTILGYELLSHLLKHRFLDAILSFNFDELLDQSLDDELGSDGYRRLVSDRDCANVESDPDKDTYLPLYNKLHGTATEPDSLRLTREAYYKLPQQLMEVVQGLLKSQFTAVVNVGSAMTGFDLHRLLRIPEELEVYDLSPLSVERSVRDEITSERENPLPDSLQQNEPRPPAKFFLPAEELTRKRSCDRWLKDLVREIEYRSGKGASPDDLASLVKFRSVDRHEAVAHVLGPESTLSRWTEHPKRWRADYVDYLRKRTIVELAFSGAKARGLAQLSWLATDRSGIYYELYRREGGREVDGWNTLRSAAGLDENQWLPDVVESQPHLCDPEAGPTLDEQGDWSLREFVPREHARHVATHIGKSHDGSESRLANTLRKLQLGSEVEIQATDDRVCAKAFDSPLTLPTVTSLRVFSLDLFRDLDPQDEVYISCETGEWLLSDEEMVSRLENQELVEILTAFDFKSKGLKKRFGNRLRIHHIDPWRHNRHMTIVCKANVPMRAIYFARRLRTPMITPVYLDRPADAERVKRTFDLMRAEVPSPPNTDLVA
jgi:hypothetical protein